MPDTFWIELGILPVEVGYVPTSKAWRRTLKQLGVRPEPFPKSDGRCVYWTKVGPGRQSIILMTVGRRAGKFTQAQVAGIIAHECMHAWRHIRHAMREKKPSVEFEAYCMQALVQGAMHAHAERHPSPWKKSRT